MELWFIYSLLSALFAGLFTFGLKITAEKDLQSNLLTAIYFFVAALLSLVTWVVTGTNREEITFAIVVAGSAGLLLSGLYVIQVQGLKYIDAAIFYPLYKTFGPLLVIIAGVMYFGDDLSPLEYVALGLSLLIPLMLISRAEKSRQNNLWRGIVILGVSVVIAFITTILAKIAVDRSVDVYLFLLIQTVFGLLANIIIGIVQGKPLKLGDVTMKYIGYGMLLGALMFGFIILTLLAFQDGLVSIVYTVQSFYILIPIVLSVIVYKEHMNMRKAVAIALSIVAIIFFQI